MTTSLLDEPLHQAPCIRRTPVALTENPADDAPIAVDQYCGRVTAHPEAGRTLAARIDPKRKSDAEVLAPLAHRLRSLAKAHGHHR